MYKNKLFYWKTYWIKIILAGILIIGLVYIANIAKKVYELLSGISLKDLLIEISKEAVSKIIESKMSELFDKIHGFFIEIIDEQIQKMNDYNVDMAFLFQLLLDLTSNREFEKQGELIN